MKFTFFHASASGPNMEMMTTLGESFFLGKGVAADEAVAESNSKPVCARNLAAVLKLSKDNAKTQTILCILKNSNNIWANYGRIAKWKLFSHGEEFCNNCSAVKILTSIIHGRSFPFFKIYFFFESYSMQWILCIAMQKKYRANKLQGMA